MTQLRSAVEQDLTAISDLFSVSYSALLPASYEDGILDVALPLITNANPELVASGKFYVIPGDAAGFLACGGWSFFDPHLREETPGLAHIRHVACHPGALRQGYASQIVRHCLEEIAGKTAKVQCYATLNAVPFYGVMGFESVEETGVTLPGDIWFPCMRMTQVLD